MIGKKMKQVENGYERAQKGPIIEGVEKFILKDWNLSSDEYMKEWGTLKAIQEWVFKKLNSNDTYKDLWITNYIFEIEVIINQESLKKICSQKILFENPGLIKDIAEHLRKNTEETQEIYKEGLAKVVLITISIKPIEREIIDAEIERILDKSKTDWSKLTKKDLLEILSALQLPITQDDIEENPNFTEMKEIKEEMSRQWKEYLGILEPEKDEKIKGIKKETEQKKIKEEYWKLYRFYYMSKKLYLGINKKNEIILNDYPEKFTIPTKLYTYIHMEEVNICK